MFSITENRGFQITFANGWTVSVQWGPHNYCENQYGKFPAGQPVPNCSNAEIAAWDENGRWHRFQNDDVQGWVSPDDVAAFITEIASRSSDDNNEGETNNG